MHRFFLISASLTLAAGMAQAQAGPGTGQFFSRVDGDGNGRIERPELSSAMMARRARQSPTGVAASAAADIPARVEAVFSAADHDADGGLSRTELQTKAAEIRFLLAQP